MLGLSGYGHGLGKSMDWVEFSYFREWENGRFSFKQHFITTASQN
jgi:hypothetical protein